jgi:hypothetical protein
MDVCSGAGVWVKDPWMDGYTHLEPGLWLEKKSDDRHAGRQTTTTMKTSLAGDELL